MSANSFDGTDGPFKSLKKRTYRGTQDAFNMLSPKVWIFPTMVLDEIHAQEMVKRIVGYIYKAAKVLSLVGIYA